MRKSQRFDISTTGINKDILPLGIQIEQLNDQLLKSRVVNPLEGTVISKYAEQNEMVAAGKPLYKIADLSEIILRVYISANQLPQVKLNQPVKVHTDDGTGGFAETEGMITWISDKAEFTPKTIQTKEERANLVYAMKVKVKNDGTYKKDRDVWRNQFLIVAIHVRVFVGTLHATSLRSKTHRLCKK